MSDTIAHKEQITARLDDYRLQYNDGFITLAEFRNATVNFLIRDDVQRVIDQDEARITAEIQADPKMQALLARLEE